MAVAFAACIVLPKIWARDIPVAVFVVLSPALRAFTRHVITLSVQCGRIASTWQGNLVNRQFWIGELGAVITNVLMIFVTPYVLKWRDKRALISGRKKTEKVRQHYRNVLVYALEPHSLTQYLVLQVLFAFFPTGLMIVGMVWQAVVAIGIESPAQPDNYFRIYWNGLAFLLWFVGAAGITRLTSKSAELWLHIKSFDEYVGSVPGEFRDLDLERLAHEKLKFPPA